MLKNYLTVALRTLRRHKGYTFINVLGLAVGIACCLLIALFVRDELSFDRFHENGERIYRVLRTPPGETEAQSHFEAPVGPALASGIAGVEHAVRFKKSAEAYPTLVVADSVAFYEANFAHADAALFDVFSFEPVAGDLQSALERPFTVVLTASTARKYFGNASAIGRMISAGNGDDLRDYEVTAVVRDLPATSSITVDLIGSFATLYETNYALTQNGGWNMSGFATYLLLRDGTAPSEVAEQVPSVLGRMVELSRVTEAAYVLEPLTDVYLRTDVPNRIGPSSDIRYVYIFGTVALLILLVACINYMNLATARSARRSREVGVRKVVGAGRAQLVRQFLSESVLLCGLAVGVALLLVEIALGPFNVLVGKQLAVPYAEAGWLAALLGGVVLLVGLLAGSYPALVLSRFRPADVLKGSGGPKSRGSRLRQGLVVFQFAVSIALLVCTAIIARQLNYVQAAQPGMDREQVLVVAARGVLTEDEALRFKQAVLALPPVQRASVSSGVPSQGFGGYMTQPEQEPGAAPSEGVFMSQFGIDTDFLDVLGMEIVAGRGFSEAHGTDATALLVNEAAVRAAGWRDPIGKKLGFGRSEGVVVGVVRDFHFESMHAEITPVFIGALDWPGFVSMRLTPGDFSGSLAAVRSAWEQIAPDRPFDYYFLDDAFDALYRSEQRLAGIFSAFFVLVVFIACLGLFGLAAFTAEQRRKEIGVRKVLGASVAGLVALLSKDYLKLVFVSFLLAAPVAYYVSKRWLEDFAYRIDLGPGVFVLAGAAALLIALLTVSYQSIRAARADPVKTLRAE